MSHNPYSPLPKESGLKLKKVTTIFDPNMDKKYLVQPDNGEVFVSGLCGSVPAADFYFDDVKGRRMLHMGEIENLYEIEEDND